MQDFISASCSSSDCRKQKASPTPSHNTDRRNHWMQSWQTGLFEGGASFEEQLYVWKDPWPLIQAWPLPVLSERGKEWGMSNAPPSMLSYSQKIWAKTWENKQSLKKSEREIILSLQDFVKELWFQLIEENEKSCKQRHCLLLSWKWGIALLAAKHNHVQNFPVELCGAHETQERESHRKNCRTSCSLTQGLVTQTFHAQWSSWEMVNEAGLIKSKM